jgi:hypothetical protein
MVTPLGPCTVATPPAHFTTITSVSTHISSLTCDLLHAYGPSASSTTDVSSPSPQLHCPTSTSPDLSNNSPVHLSLAASSHYSSPLRPSCSTQSCEVLNPALLYVPNSNLTLSSDPASTSPNSNPPTHPMITRSKNHITKQPKSFTDGTVRYPIPQALLAEIASSVVEPTCFTFSIKDENWRKAMNI